MTSPSQLSVTNGGAGESQVTILRTREDVAQAVADEFAKIAEESISRSGRFSVALAGGSTPRDAYLQIAEAELSGSCRLPWDKIHVFFGDERPVPPDDAASNYRMANESLLSRVPIPGENVHRIRAELEPSAAAQEYERELQKFFDQGTRGFDLVLLGMGPDGHTASLFPNTAALSEESRLVVANWVEKLKQSRLTLTLPVFNRSGQVLFVVVGSDKASVLQQVLTDKEIKYPAQRVRPLSGQLRWIVDEDAARLLPRGLKRAG